MHEFIKNTKEYWTILAVFVGLIATWTTFGDRLTALETSDAKQEIKIEKQDLILRKIEVDVAYIRALLEKK